MPGAAQRGSLLATPPACAVSTPVLWGLRGLGEGETQGCGESHALDGPEFRQEAQLQLLLGKSTTLTVCWGGQGRLPGFCTCLFVYIVYLVGAESNPGYYGTE